MNDASPGLFSDILGVFAVLGMLGTVAMAVLRLRAASQREEEQDRERAALAAAYSLLAAGKVAAETRAAELAMILEGMDDAVMLTDPDFRILHWNERWGEVAGVPPGVLRPGHGLEDLLRAQAQVGEFGRVDVEAEVARRMQRLRTFGPGEDIYRDRPEGRRIRLRRRVLPSGHMVSVASDVTALAPAAAVETPRGPARRAAGLRRCFVLLVEDLVVNQMVTATQLRRDGHRVEVASSGMEALEKLRRQPCDIVLMDLMMPGMSGLQTAEAIRRMDGFMAAVPILALTATAGEQERARCLAAGMQGMLSKPVRAAELTAAMAEVLAPGAAEVVRRAQTTAAPVAPEVEAPPPPVLLDHARLEELRQGLPGGLFADLAEQCVVEMRERMMELHEALEVAEFRRIEAAAHALAGMAGSYAMAAVERRMRAIMGAARRRDLRGANEAAGEMTQELVATEAGLRDWMGRAA